VKNNKLKKVLSGVSAFALMSLAAGQAAAAPVYRFVGDGEFAEAWLDDGATCGYVYVTRGGTANSPQTYLYYLMYDCGNGAVSETGYGMIPNANLQGDGSGRLSLTTDTSGANFTRDVGNGGAVALTWNKTVDFSTKWAGSSQTTYHDSTGYSYHATGTGQTSSASIQGSVVGHAVSATYADMGKNNSVQLVIERGQ
jgi:hypothetical protein